MSDPVTRDDLVASFSSYGQPRERWRIGGEFERAVVHPDGRPVRYDEPQGIRWILEQLAARDGWTLKSEDGFPIEAERAGASITLEPGGQVELSGAPHSTLGALAAEMRANRADLLSVTADTPLVWIACGLTPIAAIEDIDWMPKGRYRVMREYLPKKGDLAHWMMKGTTSVQANFDYADEADCARKVEMTTSLAPLVTAIFANSPLYRNEPTGFKSMRAHVWTRTDNDRAGFPAAIRHYSHEAWVDYLLDVPMMFVKREGRWLDARGTTFRTFMTEGFDGRRPTEADWRLHQTSVFPEVRVKHTIEVRCADCVDHELALGFCALFTGLMYCTTALDEATQLGRAFTGSDDVVALSAIAARQGLEGVVQGRSMADWARDLGDIALRGLRNCLPDDVGMLDRLLEGIAAGSSPADEVLAAWHRDPSPEAVVRSVRY